MLLSMSALVFLHLHEFRTGNREAIFSGSKTQQPAGKRFQFQLPQHGWRPKKKVIDGTRALKSQGEFLLHQILIRH